MIAISIHPPLAGRDDVVYDVCILKPISIHPPLAGRDRCHAELQDAECISIHPPLAGRDSIRAPNGAKSRISIHPPLAGRDTSLFVGFAFCSDFNPPAPCGAGPLIRYWAQMEMQFQSTRPLRGGALPSHCNAGRDMVATAAQGQRAYFNPPAPCGAGQRSCTKKLCKTSHIAQKVHLPWPY